MQTIIYTQKNCPGCVGMKAKMDKEGIPYEEIEIGTDISVSEFRALYPDVRSVPFVVKMKE